MEKNYYQILGLQKDATSEEIKKAYKLYAFKFHPDKQDGDKFFEERFKEIKEAYDILSDVDKRKLYDSSFEKKNSYANNFEKNYSQEPYNQEEYTAHFDSPVLCITNEYLYFKITGEQYLLSDLEEVIYKKELNGLTMLLGVIFVIVGVINWVGNFYISLMFVIMGVISFFSKGRGLTVVDKSGREIDMPSTYRKCDEIVQILRSLNVTVRNG